MDTSRFYAAYREDGYRSWDSEPWPSRCGRPAGWARPRRGPRCRLRASAEPWPGRACGPLATASDGLSHGQATGAGPPPAFARRAPFPVSSACSSTRTRRSPGAAPRRGIRSSPTSAVRRSDGERDRRGGELASWKSDGHALGPRSTRARSPAAPIPGHQVAAVPDHARGPRELMQPSGSTRRALAGGVC
jgi:hypothetical protein